jgi:hypothetical protein
MDDLKQLTVRIEMNLYNEIKMLADSECRNINQQIEFMLKKYMEIKR